jgi:hypothetical protein
MLLKTKTCLGKLDEERTISNEGSFTLAELQKEYEKWLERTCPQVHVGGTVPLKDFRTGLSESRTCGHVVFQLAELFKTKIVEENKPDTKMVLSDKRSDKSKRLGEFENALKD